MTTRELDHALDAGGWLFVDNSGDGGAFGFHMKPLHGGKYILAISTGGKGTDDDYLYPVTFTDWATPVDVMLGIYQDQHNNTPLPTTPDDFMSSDVFGTCHVTEMLFPNVGKALECAEFLASYLKP